MGEFCLKCGRCNHSLKKQTNNDLSNNLICCIGKHPIAQQSVYYECGVCKRKFIVCEGCKEYSALLSMLRTTISNRYRLLNRSERYYIDKSIKHKLKTKYDRTSVNETLKEQGLKGMYWLNPTIQLRTLLLMRHKLFYSIKQSLLQLTIQSDLNEYASKYIL